MKKYISKNFALAAGVLSAVTLTAALLAPTNAAAQEPASKAAKSGALSALSDKEMVDLLEELDRRQHAAGDYKAEVYIDQREKGKSALLYEANIYRRDDDDKMIILFNKPRSEAGKGYLKIGQNMFMYDPNVGKWERRTERERIGGTGSQRRDFDEWNLARDFTPSYEGSDKLGKFQVHHLKLTAKDRNKVAYPHLEIWVDAKSQNVLKAQEFALSGRLMRTTYYPKWDRIQSKTKGDWVYFPKEIRIFDEVEEGTRTLIAFKQVDLDKLPENIFTKAWLESKSR